MTRTSFDKVKKDAAQSREDTPILFTRMEKAEKAITEIQKKPDALPAAIEKAFRAEFASAREEHRLWF